MHPEKLRACTEQSRRGFLSEWTKEKDLGIQKWMYASVECTVLIMDVQSIRFMRREKSGNGIPSGGWRRRESKANNRSGGYKDLVFAKEWKNLVYWPLGKVESFDQSGACLVAVTTGNFNCYLRPSLPILPPQDQATPVSLCLSQTSSHPHHNLLWEAIQLHLFKEFPH